MTKYYNTSITTKKMECSKCKMRLDLTYFSKRFVKSHNDYIYYLRCDICRKKQKEKQGEYDNEKEKYEICKIANTIKCECGKTYSAFRTYHHNRHLGSKRHIEYEVSKDMTSIRELIPLMNMKELWDIAQKNKIPYYKTLKKDKLQETILRLEKVVYT